MWVANVYCGLLPVFCVFFATGFNLFNDFHLNQNFYFSLSVLINHISLNLSISYNFFRVIIKLFIISSYCILICTSITISLYVSIICALSLF